MNVRTRSRQTGVRVARLASWLALLLPALLSCRTASAVDVAGAILLSTSLPIAAGHLPDLALDGNPATSFKSARPPRAGDDFLLTLPAGTRLRSVEVQTGDHDGHDVLENGALEFSRDGTNFNGAVPFVRGTARLKGLRGEVRQVRLRATAGGTNDVAIREIKLTAAAPFPPARFVTRVEVDCTAAPAAAEFARRSGDLCAEWYPRIRQLLASDDAPPPASVIKLIFLPMDGVAATSGSTIQVSTDWVTKRAPDDYGMIVHELTHVAQDYRGAGEGWLTEGIADYIRHRHFEPTAWTPRVDPARESYRNGYKPAAAFLMWLEKTKDANIVNRLNAASRRGRYTPGLFRESTGQDLDDLWREFAATFHRP